MEEQTIMQQTDDRNAEIDRKLRQFFDGRIVRKDLTADQCRAQNFNG